AVALRVGPHSAPPRLPAILARRSRRSSARQTGRPSRIVRQYRDGYPDYSASHLSHRGDQMSQQDTGRQGPAAAPRPPAGTDPARRAGWGAADIPDQSGRIAVITGANTGIGLEAARFLAGAGAHVVLAGRNPDKT